jgi:hypothetical protein
LQNKSREGIPWWPDLEEHLYERFWERRQQRLVTSTGWFRRQARELFFHLLPREPTYLYLLSRVVHPLPPTLLYHKTANYPSSSKASRGAT